LQPERVKELYAQLEAEGRDVSLQIFAGGETVGHAGSSTPASAFIFDWIEGRIGPAAARHGRRSGAATRRARDA
jgi:hypothetical protein